MNPYRTIILCVAFSFTCIAGRADEKPDNNDTVNYKGNVFEVNDVSEIVLVEDKTTGEVYITKENPFPIPVKMNGLNIYTENDVDKPSSLTGEIFKLYLLNNMPALTSTLPDGIYYLYIDNIITGPGGKVVYYNFDGIRKRDARGEKRLLAKSYLSKVEKKIEQLVEKGPVYKPALIYQQGVPCRIDNSIFNEPFYIKGGRVFYHP